MKLNKTGSRWDGIREELITNMTNRRREKWEICGQMKK
jgi:hypothetical protein